MDEKRSINVSLMTDSRQAGVFRVLLILALGLFALSLVAAALPWDAWAAEDAGDEATWSNTPPTIIKASEDEEGGLSWSETAPTIITADAGDGESSWYNSPPEIVASSTAQYDLAWNRTVPVEAAAR